jgi:hypothetical protein
MSKELFRIYSMPDSEMLTETKTMLEIAKQDIKELQVAEPTLTPAEIESNIVEVNTCINDYSSLEGRSSITVATQNLQDIMQNCKEEVQVFFFHCERALSDRATASIEFGRKGVEKARNNPEKMVSLLNLVITNYGRPEYEAKLEARLGKGYKAKLVGIKTQLTDAIAAQSLAKASRPADTEARIAKYNAVWTFARNIGEIGKVAFRGSYAKQQQYTLYDTPAPKKDSGPTKQDTDLPGQDEEQA